MTEPANRFDPEVERALRESDELVLVTGGRRTGALHPVALRFAYADGAVWLRTEPRAPRDAVGVRVRRPGDASGLPDWFRNLLAEPRCVVRIAGRELVATYEPAADQAAALRETVALWRVKYGADWVEDWYVDAGRTPVRLRLES